MNTNLCPNCNAPNAPQAKFCARCGKPLPSRPLGQAYPQAPAAQAPQPAQGGFSKCPRCSSPLRGNARFCPVCGLTMGGAPAYGATMSAGAGAPAAPPVGAPGPGGATQMLGAAGGAPNLMVRYPGGNVQKYVLSAPRMTLGRAPGNDLLINFPVVSGHHMVIEQRGLDQITITDLNSTNGTMINGQRIQPNVATPFLTSDVIRIGDMTGNSVSMTLETEGGESLRTLALGRLDLSAQATITIGRDSSSYLPLNHPTVSSRHAVIQKQNGGLVIRDLASRNGTFVNGARISQVPLQSGDVIQIGPFKLVYDAQAQSLAQSRSMGHRLDAVQLCREVAKKKMILTNVNMCIQSGEFVALVGGSGAGKSTLMKALNGFEPGTHGQMLLDGEPLYPKLDLYRTQMGYVPQDDIIHRELPVKLALWYAAKLRLPDASNAEIDQRIQEALKSVEMTEHADKKVKVLSGGQRKRVSIAVELLAKPSLFFLDEPTSGLDPGLEKKMMYDLNHLADEGRTVVLVTHATANIQQCDYVAFMTWGRLAYYGPPSDAITFFGVQDFADIYLKLSQTVDPSKGKPPPQELAPYYPAYQSQGKVSSGHLWADHYARSQFYQKYVTDRQRNLGPGTGPGATPMAAAPMKVKDSFIRQMIILARRQFDLIRNDIRTLVILLAMMPFIGLMFMAVTEGNVLVGPEITAECEDEGITTQRECIDYRLKHDLEGEAANESKSATPYADAKILLVMIGLALTQGGTFGAAYEIVKERAIFRRERAVNLSVLSYVLSKFIVLALFAVVQVISVVLIISIRVDMGFEGILAPDMQLGATLELLVTLYLAVLASITFGLFISALVPNTDIVLYIILAQLFIQIILSGTLFPMPSNPLSYATPGYWTMRGMAATVDLKRLDDLGRACKVAEIPNQETGEKELKTVCDEAHATEQDLKNLDNFKHESENLYLVWAALVGHVFMWLLITYIVQVRKKVD